MRIKKIELIGFKSFKDRTQIHFDSGITGIVGPNGCGKSNIVDALVWVMGEMSAKDLRGSAMTDVIFAGAEGYAPMGMAEVSLTLENDGGPFPAKYARQTEIMVTRRLHRSGESEYFINKEEARLKDIQEIFMDTGAGAKGFSIIQQGMIGKIITAKPEDRRNLIEEAAGITKFKARKRESQRKLQDTEQNLVRLQDIVGELKRQIDSLGRQAQKASRYRQLKSQIEELDLWVTSRHFQSIKEETREFQFQFEQVQSQYLEGAAESSSLKANLEELRLDLLALEKRVENSQNEHFAQLTLVQKKELEIQGLKLEIDQAQKSQLMTVSLHQEQKARLDLLQKELQQVMTHSQVLKSEAESLQALYDEKNELYQEVQIKVQDIEEELTVQRRELFAIGQSESAVEAKAQALHHMVSDLKDRETQEELVQNELQLKRFSFQERLDKLNGQMEKERAIQTEMGIELRSLEDQKSKISILMSDKKDEVEGFKNELNEVTGTLYGLENLHRNFEGFSDGVKNVMLWQKSRTNPSFQPVSEVVEVPSEYEVAMEAALGSRLQVLLSNEDTSHVLDAVDYLKANKSGRSSFFTDGEGMSFSTHQFIPADSAVVSTERATQEQEDLQESSKEWASQEEGGWGPKGEDFNKGGASSSSALSSEVGVKAILKDIMKVPAKYDSTVGLLLKDVAIVDSLRTALHMRPQYPGWTFVTLEGDTLSVDGVLTGGAKEGADSGVLKRKREIKDLSRKKDEWSGKWALAQEVLRRLEEEHLQLSLQFEMSRKKLQEQDIKVTEVRKDFERAETEFDNSKYACERHEKQILKIKDQLNGESDRLESLEQSLLQIRQKKDLADEKSERLHEEMQQARLGFEGIQLEVTDLQVKAAAKNQEYQGVKKQYEMIEKSMLDLQAQISKMDEESQKSSNSMSENQLKLEEEKILFERLIQSVENAKSSLSSVKNEFEQVLAQVRQSEGEEQILQKQQNERQQKMNEFQLKFEQTKMKEQYLVDQIRERYMLDLKQVHEEHLSRGGDLYLAESELSELKERLGKMGEVNLSAIEEFEETSKRYEFLSQQQTDLTEAKEQLRKVIERINRIVSKRFTDTFDLVNERFQKVFPVLFGGGEARLEMVVDPEDADADQGIDIIAQPPGKKMQNISLLSGGEKALTAVSLVFSIFLVKPSPYCLLDEVDAPLDDANVYRFNELVREMSKRSQIIVVTHNKHTMEVVGKLYGVTMQERGVSTMVSVNL